MADVGTGWPTDAALKVSDPERIPARRYYDAAFYESECRRLWPRAWQMACRLEEIPEIGDFTRYDILDQSVIVVRTAAGIKAFHNSCRHRGVQFAQGSGNCKTRGFICPFHGWRWDMNGKNTFVFARQVFSDHNLDPATIDLVPCRVELWGGCAFINLDDDAPPLAECLGPVAGVLEARHADKMRVDWWRSTILPVNWKLALEAFMESYHVMRTHPQIQGTGGGFNYGNAPPLPATGREKIADAIEQLKLLSEGMAGMVVPSDVAIAEELRDMEIPEDSDEAVMLWGMRLNEEIASRGRARGLDVPDLNAVAQTHPAEAVQFIFPNYFLLPLFGNMASYRVRPLGPESCLFELWSLTLYPEGETRPRPMPPLPSPLDDPSWPEVPQQDFANLPLQQRGLHSNSFGYMRLARRVEGMISNYQRLIDGFIDGIDADRLADGMRRTNGDLDSPVRDIGF